MILFLPFFFSFSAAEGEIGNGGDGGGGGGGEVEMRRPRRREMSDTYLATCRGIFGIYSLGMYFFPCDARCTGSRQGGDRRQPCSIRLSSAGRGRGRVTTPSSCMVSGRSNPASDEVTSAGEWIQHVKGRFRFVFIRFPYRRRVFSPSSPGPASSPSCFSLLEISQDDGGKETRNRAKHLFCSPKRKIRKAGVEISLPRGRPTSCHNPTSPSDRPPFPFPIYRSPVPQYLPLSSPTTFAHI
ncbi:uncharacterized protein K489DRAFT_260534 [Dissoconium aciculare CBS 342.82]|uniref:Uncharacterized protein n=1 Tax=Dissoconium aciculare CBS 342.82 TaxID=1314786 RepID=A0A6J3M1W6_9PEZI|nr:uncharacterized protein K489DRAFT_260534 [Dissoconium aciculare CBS 342.82]KAF1820917.1 hypothetical protein K489DRAFT_260534 [Dissoconium aciculare CBS 342.82]